MSTILKALNRIEEDRDTQKQPDPIRTDIPLASYAGNVPLPRFARSKGARPSVWALAGAVIVSVGLLSWQMLGDDVPEAASAGQPAAVSEVGAIAATPVEPSGPLAEAKASRALPTVGASAAELPATELVERRPPEAPAEPLEQSSPVRSPLLRDLAAALPEEGTPQLLIDPEPGEGAVASNPIAGALSAGSVVGDAPAASTGPESPATSLTAEWAVPTPGRRSEPVAAARPAERIPEDPPEVAAGPSPEIAAAAAAPSVRESLPPIAAAPPIRPAPSTPVVIPPPPPIRVLETAWHPDAGLRSARVTVGGHGENLDLREGDAVGAVVVVSIHPTSVVFLHGGQEIKKRVGDK